ncbi:hypothetical protein CPB86DRAFT_78187 [Serendipita vermifera]|nr:hypothetical protein CPB86DRAFT_78187 [Serendipita vermifera]
MLHPSERVRSHLICVFIADHHLAGPSSTKGKGAQRARPQGQDTRGELLARKRKRVFTISEDDNEENDDDDDDYDFRPRKKGKSLSTRAMGVKPTLPSIAAGGSSSLAESSRAAERRAARAQEAGVVCPDPDETRVEKPCKFFLHMARINFLTFESLRHGGERLPRRSSGSGETDSRG